MQYRDIEDMHASLAKYLCDYRAKKGWSLREAARHMNVSASTLSALERGHRTTVTMQTLVTLAYAMNTSVKRLLGA